MTNSQLGFHPISKDLRYFSNLCRVLRFLPTSLANQKHVRFSAASEEDMSMHGRVSLFYCLIFGSFIAERAVRSS